MKWIAHVNQPTNLCLLSGWDLLSWFLRWFKDNLKYYLQGEEKQQNLFCFLKQQNSIDGMIMKWGINWRIAMQ
jgi:hypothetical protein